MKWLGGRAGGRGSVCECVCVRACVYACMWVGGRVGLGLWEWLWSCGGQGSIKRAGGDPATPLRMRGRGVWGPPPTTLVYSLGKKSHTTRVDDNQIH